MSGKMLGVNAIVNASSDQAETSIQSNQNSISRLEKRRLMQLIAGFLFVTTLPYLWAFAVTPPGFVYSGLLFSPDDQNVHLMWARQTAESHLLVQDLFTTEHLSSGEKPLFNNLLTSLIGTLSRLPGFSLIVAYHVVRLAAGALCLWWFYQLAAQLSGDRRVRFFATALAAFSSGGGWLRDVLPFLAGRVWMDRPDNAGLPMMPEGFAFPSLLIFPLNAASLALLALIYACVLQAQSDEKAKQKRALCTGFSAALLLSNIHTYDALPLGATLLLWAAFCGFKDKSKALAPLLIASGTLPPLLYQFYVFKNSSEFQLKAITVTAPPQIADVLLSYTPLLLLALYGMWALRHHQSARLLTLWAIVTLVSIYTPVEYAPFARKMIEGLHLPLCFFAATAIVELFKNRTIVMQRIAFAGSGAFLCLSSLQFLGWCLADAPKSIIPYRGHMPPLYLSLFDDPALRDLNLQYEKDKAAGKKPAAVLSLSFIGNYVPQRTGYHAYLGHWAETLDFNRKMNEVYKFYRGEMPRDEALKWLRQNHIRYVFYGFYEAGVFPSAEHLYNLFGKPLIRHGPNKSSNEASMSDNPPALIYIVPES
jgi:hypothetical protein